MPIFEYDEPITSNEMKRQQAALNAKVRRKEFADQYENMVNESFGHDGGDCWEDEPDDHFEKPISPTNPRDPTFKIIRVGDWKTNVDG